MLSELADEVLVDLKQLGSTAKTAQELRNDPIIQKRIQEGLDKANSRYLGGRFPFIGKYSASSIYEGPFRKPSM